MPSMSSRTIVYKGMLLAHQVGEYYLDLQRRDAWCRRWRWCTSASRPTRSRRGISRIRSASSATTARSTRCAATSTGSARGSRRIASTVLGDDLDKIWPLIYDGQSDSASFDNALELLRDGRLSARARDDADDPRGVGRQSADGRGSPRVLRIPRRADGAVGRSRGDGVHRRPADRRDARSQRAAAGALHRHRRRLRR